MDNIVTIFLTIIVLIGVIALLYVLLYNNLQAHKIKINEAESIIDDILRKKYDLLITIKKIITENTDVKDNRFEDIDNLKNINISSFDFERKLTDFNSLINQIKTDHSKLENNENFNNNYEEIYKLNERLEATKVFYNKYTTILNKLIKKFPSNIIAKIHHMNVQTFFDGKDMFDEIDEDFKL